MVKSEKDYIVPNWRWDKWQKEILDHQGNITLRSGRQVGKSEVIARKAFNFALSYQGTVTMIIAASQRQSSLLPISGSRIWLSPQTPVFHKYFHLDAGSPRCRLCLWQPSGQNVRSIKSVNRCCKLFGPIMGFSFPWWNNRSTTLPWF